MEQATSGAGVPGAETGPVAGYVREAWSQALVAAGDAGEDVQALLRRMAGWVELQPDEARRLAIELSERLRRERSELESSVEAALSRAVAPLRRGTRDEVQALEARIRRLEARIEARLASRRAGA
jgi:polyhydroxyalkanoate synthesis regulator phasin